MGVSGASENEWRLPPDHNGFFSPSNQSWLALAVRLPGQERGAPRGTSTQDGILLNGLPPPPHTATTKSRSGRVALLEAASVVFLLCLVTG